MQSSQRDINCDSQLHYRNVTDQTVSQLHTHCDIHNYTLTAEKPLIVFGNKTLNLKLVCAVGGAIADIALYVTYLVSIR